ncbi:uncharacterized protein MELLADRAFT_76045 [Melampsora larici-populina 98AG31]|uniref:Ubiquinone biosynthesis protein n=1 Tax=Melampsora larici-populina (strain 98AG31 / pathotype 3-4-7) TaxID=747676 RepID=F4S9L4_MELLP|nr:uncharacterized protein MELLADRAFT_76045 [Melampsora larici-populina 98AG31]EGF98681.1 hypothetical protein MELLADRAFT_76045 [Melampsora larici-populina 98AG31]
MVRSIGLLSHSTNQLRNRTTPASFCHVAFGLKSSIPLKRSLSTTLEKNRAVAYVQSIEDQILDAALPFVPQTGFTIASLMAGIHSTPTLAQLSIQPHTLTGIFPGGTKLVKQRSSEPIGPIKALASRWLEQGNVLMKQTLLDKCITLEKHGIEGVRIAFESRLKYNHTVSRDDLLQCLLLTVTPAEPFFGIPLPFEPPHILPYGSHALDVSAAALSGLKDYSLSREWMLRRIRMAGVYSVIELSTLMNEASEPTWIVDDRLRSLLAASESASMGMADTVEFINYVFRSSRAIANSMGIL